MIKILVIDSDLESQRFLRETFQSNGYETLVTGDGYQGLRLAFETLPDLIFCELTLSTSSGCEILGFLRQNAITDVIPFLFFTATADRALERQAMLLGADGILSKPGEAQDLLDTVRWQLQKKARYDRHTEQRLDQLRENIATSLPHELNTALNGILGSTDLLLMMLGSLSRSDEKELLEVIQNSAKRLHHMTENFWLYTRLTIKSRQGGELSAFVGLQADPKDVITRVAEAEAKKYDRSRDLSVNLEDGCLLISETDLHKLATEVIDNAFKFSQPGSAVEVEGVTEGGRYRLSVQDYGRGMTEEQIDNIGAFIQFDRERYEQQGLGLGLAIVKRLVEIYRGHIFISGSFGQGTRVIILLPFVVQIV